MFRLYLRRLKASYTKVISKKDTVERTIKNIAKKTVSLLLKVLLTLTSPIRLPLSNSCPLSVTSLRILDNRFLGLPKS
jgi:hypothetical protein